MSVNPDDGIVRLLSKEPVADLLQRLLSILRGKGITVFAVIDHSGEAARAGLELPETKLVIFGRPEAGTPLMVAAPESALDLPLKLLIAARPDGGSQVSYNSAAWLRSRYGLPAGLMLNVAVLEQLAATLVAQP